MTTESEKLTIPNLPPVVLTAPATPATKLTKAGKLRKPRGPRPDRLLLLQRAGQTNAWNIYPTAPFGLKKSTPAKIKGALEERKIPGEYKTVAQKGLGFVIAVEKVELATCKDIE